MPAYSISALLRVPSFQVLLSVSVSVQLQEHHRFLMSSSGCRLRNEMFSTVVNGGSHSLAVSKSSGCSGVTRLSDTCLAGWVPSEGSPQLPWRASHSVSVTKPNAR